MTTEETVRERFSAAVEKTLNRHGYGFQYSVINTAFKLFELKESYWYFEAVEFPVEVQGSSTRIDFVLRKYNQGNERPFFILAECKRVNPALANWCFARVPFIHRDRSYEPLIMERAQLDDTNRLYSSAQNHSDLQNAYHIALEIKTDEKGDSSGQGRGTIEEASTQVCRGLNGMVEFFARNIQMFGQHKSADFLPVIFTTADLWVTDTRLQESSLDSGNVAIDRAGISPQPWVAYQYHMSPGLKHGFSTKSQTDNLGKILDAEYIRTIPVVSSSGIAPFLKWASQRYFY